MKQLQLRQRHSLLLNLNLHHASSPCKLFMPLGFPLSRPTRLPTLCLSSQPFNRTTTSSRLICKMNRNSDMISQFELGKPEERRKSEKHANGIFWIILLNLGIYIADHVFQVRAIKALYLYHNWPAWYQFITATFCHLNWNHLSSNLFFLYIFGKLVEEEEGNFALWLSYILTGVGANLVSWLVLPRNAVSIGASGAVFGLFAVSVLVKMSWDWRKILEVLILGQFVIEKIHTKYLLNFIQEEAPFTRFDFLFRWLAIYYIKRGNGSSTSIGRVSRQSPTRLCLTECESHSPSLRSPGWCSSDLAS